MPFFFFSDYSGNVLTTEKRSNFQLRAMQNFVTSIEDYNNPKQKLYGRYMIAGPIPITLAGSDILMYVGFKWNEPPPLLLRLFDQMVEAVNQMISGQQRLLSDISHELRSPLTRLRMASALATRKQGESPELTRIDTEAQRLEQMISELLELSRMQANSHMTRETQPLESLWEEIIKDAQFEAEQMGKQLHYSELPKRNISGNPKLLMSAVENIVRNAIYYGKDEVQIDIKADDDTLRITVDDNGEGVPEEELAAIFRPFYRVSTARDRHSGGTGLGLTITESAIRQHSGTIAASRSPLGGLRMSITLPINC
ncbi:ATP-binding protein [Vibrio alginolyticus]